MTTQKKGVVLYDFEANGTNEISVKAKDVVEIVKDLTDEDLGWTLVLFQGKQGIIPTKYYKLEVLKSNTPQNTWNIRLNFKKITNFAPSTNNVSPISITWSTRKKMGNTGQYFIPKEGGDLPMNKIYDVVEVFTESSSNGRFKGKHLKILLKTDTFEREIEDLLLNQIVDLEEKKKVEKIVRFVINEDQTKTELHFDIETTPYKK